MSVRPVSAGTRRACLLLTVAGTLVLMAGVLLGVVPAVLGQFGPGGGPLGYVVSAVLIAMGLFCGVTVVAVSGPGSYHAGTRVTGLIAPASPRRAPDPAAAGGTVRAAGQLGAVDPWPGSPGPP